MFTVGSWLVKKGKEEEFIAEVEAFGRWGRENQPGAESVALLRDIDNASHFITVGEWRDLESVAAWARTPEYAAFRSKVAELCDRFQFTNTEFVLNVGSPRLEKARETETAQ